MARDARTSARAGAPLLESTALLLAALTAVAALAHRETGPGACLAPPAASVGRPAAPVESSFDQDAALRDMLLHD